MSGLKRTPFKRKAPVWAFERGEREYRMPVANPDSFRNPVAITKAAEPINKTEAAHMTTKMEQKHKDAVAALGCAMCQHIHGPHAPGPVELHHLRADGWGKGGVLTLIPLCVNHHRGKEGIHNVGTKLWEREFGITQQQLLDWTLKQIN